MKATTNRCENEKNCIIIQLKIFTNQLKNILNEKINFEKQFINISNNDRNN